MPHSPESQFDIPSNHNVLVVNEGGMSADDQAIADLRREQLAEAAASIETLQAQRSFNPEDYPESSAARAVAENVGAEPLKFEQKLGESEILPFPTSSEASTSKVVPFSKPDEQPDLNMAA